MGGLLSGKRVTLWAAVAVWIGVGVLPLFVMLATSLSSTENYTATLGSARTWSLLRNSLLLATLTTVVAGAVGVTLGVILAKTDLALPEHAHRHILAPSSVSSLRSRRELVRSFGPRRHSRRTHWSRGWGGDREVAVWATWIGFGPLDCIPSSRPAADDDLRPRGELQP